MWYVYLCSINPHRLLGHARKLLLVEHGSSGVVLLLSICCRTVMLFEEGSLQTKGLKSLGFNYSIDKLNTHSIRISSQLHVPKLNPCPLSVQLCWSDKCQVYTQVSVDWRAVDADKNTKSHRRPCWILCPAIKTSLKRKKQKKTERLICK